MWVTNDFDGMHQSKWIFDYTNVSESLLVYILSLPVVTIYKNIKLTGVVVSFQNENGIVTQGKNRFPSENGIGTQVNDSFQMKRDCYPGKEL